MAYRSRYAAPDATPRSRTSRFRIFLPTLVLLVLFGALAGFWTYASWRAGQEIDAWLDREARLGRTWTCPNREIGGFPFRIEVTCDRPSFAGHAPGRDVTGEVGRVMAVAQLQSPSHVIVEAVGPLVVASASGDRLTLEWELLHASVEGRPGAGLGQFAVEVTKPRLAMTGFGIPQTNLEAGMVDLHIRRTPDRPDSDRAYDVASRTTGLALPIADQLLGTTDPLYADIVATILQAEPLAGGAPAQEFERWRLAGGKILLNKLAVAKGTKRLDATGTLGIDDLHRPQGKLEVTLSGLDEVLQRFGLGPRAASIGGLIAGVLGGGRPPAGAGRTGSRTARRGAASAARRRQGLPWSAARRPVAAALLNTNADPQ